MKKIFLHEPDSSVFDVVSLALSDQDCEVQPLPHFNDPQIEEKLRDFKPCLVIIDCFLNKFEPSVWCKKVKSILSGINVIAFSCNIDIDQTYREMGFDGFLQKPFDIRDLEVLVRRFARQTAA